MARKTPRLPARFRDWDEYGDRYGLDVLDAKGGLVRCRACGTEWQLAHYRGKPLQRQHVCDNGCNGKPRTRRSSDYGEWARYYTPRDGYVHAEAKRAQRAWFTVRSVRPEAWAALDRFWEEVALQDDPIGYVAEREVT